MKIFMRMSFHEKIMAKDFFKSEKEKSNKINTFKQMVLDTKFGNSQKKLISKLFETLVRR